MTLAQKLLGFLNRAFDKDPGAYLGLRLNYDGAMVWQIADGWLTTVVRGGSGKALSIDLSQYTVRQLGGMLSLLPGYSVPYSAEGAEGDASALRLLEGSGSPSESNGDHLLVYTSILYAWIAAQAQELALARVAIGGIGAEMSTTTADGDWLDYLGTFYRVARQAGEPDQVYGTRIITEVLRPAGNNVALEAAIRSFTGQAATITDVVIYRMPEPSFGGNAHFDGVYHFQAQQQPVYGLFDARVGYDLLRGAPPAQFVAAIRRVVEKLRDAGTQLRDVSLTGGQLSDMGPLPGDDADTLSIYSVLRFNGGRSFNGAAHFSGPSLTAGTMSGADNSVTILKTSVPLIVMAGDVPIVVMVRGADALYYPVEAEFNPLAV